MEEFVENFYSFEYGGNLHSTDDTNFIDGKDNNDYQTTALETEDVKEEIDEPEQTDLKLDKNLHIRILTDNE